MWRNNPMDPMQESALAVVVAVSVEVWLLLQAASKPRPRAATGAAQREVPWKKGRICTEVVII